MQWGGRGGGVKQRVRQQLLWQFAWLGLGRKSFLEEEEKGKVGAGLFIQQWGRALLKEGGSLLDHR